MQLVAGFPLTQPRSSHVGFMVDKAALGQVISEYISFPCQSFIHLLHTHHHPLSGDGTIGQKVANVMQSGLSLTLLQETTQDEPN
jgi:hypothetical protein